MDRREGEPLDLVIERKVDEVITQGFPLPRWGWAVPGPYQGSTGAERVLGWQKMRVAETLSFLPPRRECSGCGDQAHHRHQEIYQRSLFCPAICRSCHYQVHKRFDRPEEWKRLLEAKVDPASWFWTFPRKPITRDQAMQVAAEADLVSALRRLSSAQR